MLAELGRDAFPAGLSATIVVYEVDDIDKDSADLFDIFNNPKSVRTNTDKVAFYTGGHPELKGLAPKFLNRIAGGIHMYINDLKEQNKNAKEKDRDVRIENIPQYSAREYGLYFVNHSINREFAQWLGQWQKSPNEFVMSKTGVIAVMRSNFETDRQFATEFWAQVFTEVGTNEEDDTRLYSRKLRDWMLSRNKKDQDAFKKETSNTWKKWAKTRHEQEKTRILTERLRQAEEARSLLPSPPSEAPQMTPPRPSEAKKEQELPPMPPPSQPEPPQPTV